MNVFELIEEYKNLCRDDQLIFLRELGLVEVKGGRK